MPLLENLAEGLAGAANDPNTQALIEQRKFDRRATEHEELQAQTQSILDDVTALHQRQASLDPNSPTYQKDAGEISAALEKARQTFTDLYHPAKNPGALQHFGGFLRQHLGRRQAGSPPATPAQAKASLAQNLAGIESVAYAPGSAQAATMKPLTGTKPYKGSDGRWYQSMLRSDGTVTAIPMPEGYQPPPPTAGAKLRESIEPDANSPTGYSKVAYDLATGQEVSRQINVLPPRGFIESESVTTDPFGISSKTVRKPVVPGVSGQPSAAPSVPKTAGEAKKKAAAVAPSGAKQLDAQGHIPATAGVNRNLREAANQILDGMDVTKMPIPQRDKAAAAELARSYGWVGQGLFGPKDKLLIRESTGILKQLEASDSLSVLDDFTSRQRIGQVLQNAEKRGFIGQTIQSLAAQGLSPKEQEFITLYNQAVGRISGLSQLVRSGRATEAQIERLKTELPSPFTTSSADHARQKLKQIQNEIDIALEKGQFVEAPAATGKDMSDEEFLKRF